MSEYIIIEIALLLLYKQRGRFLFVSILVFFILFAGFRVFNVGTDTMNYYLSYGSGWGEYSYNEELGFVLLRTLLSAGGVDYRNFLLIESVLFYIPILFVIYKKTKYPIFSLFLFFSLGYCFFFFNTQRQMLATSIVTLAFYLYEKKYAIWIPISLILFAFFFHSSAIIFLGLFFVDKIRLDAKMVVAFMLLTFLLPFIISPIDLINRVINILPFFSRYNYYIESGLGSAFSINRFFLNALFVFLILKTNDTLYDRSCKLTLLGIIIINLFPIGVFKRMSDLFLFFQIFYLNKKYFQKNLVDKILIITYSVVVFFVYLYNNNGGIVPYVFSMSHE